MNGLHYLLETNIRIRLTNDISYKFYLILELEKMRTHLPKNIQKFDKNKFFLRYVYRIDLVTSTRGHWHGMIYS